MRLNAFNRKNLTFAFLLNLFLVFASTSASHAAKHVIMKPTFSAPAIVLLNGNLELNTYFKNKVVLLKASFNSSDTDESFIVELPELKAEGNNDFTINLPDNIETGMYELCISYEKDGLLKKDCRPESVSIISEYKDTFRFAIFSDYHAGDRRAEKHNPGISLKELRQKGLEALRAENPDFVLMTGDITSFPTSYDTDYRTAYNELIDGIDVPVFIVPGNHDLYSMGKNSALKIDGKKYWNKFFGPLKMAFTYGNYRFIGINSYNWPVTYRDRYDSEKIKTAGSSSSGVMGAREVSWIKNEIDFANNNNLVPILFAHHAPGLFSDFEGDESFEVMQKNDFLNYLIKNGARYYFFGHTHNNYIIDEKTLKLICTGTVASSIDEKDHWSFRMVELSQDGNFDTEVIEFWHPAEN